MRIRFKTDKLASFERHKRFWDTIITHFESTDVEQAIRTVPIGFRNLRIPKELHYKPIFMYFLTNKISEFAMFSFKAVYESGYSEQVDLGDLYIMREGEFKDDMVEFDIKFKERELKNLNILLSMDGVKIFGSYGGLRYAMLNKDQKYWRSYVLRLARGESYEQLNKEVLERRKFQPIQIIPIYEWVMPELTYLDFGRLTQPRYIEFVLRTKTLYDTHSLVDTMFQVIDFIFEGLDNDYEIVEQPLNSKPMNIHVIDWREKKELFLVESFGFADVPSFAIPELRMYMETNSAVSMVYEIYNMLFKNSILDEPTAIYVQNYQIGAIDTNKVAISRKKILQLLK